jgi:hypothetical protein
LDRPADAGKINHIYLEAFTRKIIALIRIRVKHFFGQFENFKVVCLPAKPGAKEISTEETLILSLPSY